MTTRVHALVPVLFYQSQRVTMCGIECWPCRGTNSEANTVDGNRIDIEGGTNHRVTCAKCQRIKGNENAKS